MRSGLEIGSTPSRINLSISRLSIQHSLGLILAKSLRICMVAFAKRPHLRQCARRQWKSIYSVRAAMSIAGAADSTAKPSRADDRDLQQCTRQVPGGTLKQYRSLRLCGSLGYRKSGIRGLWRFFCPSKAPKKAFLDLQGPFLRDFELSIE